MATSMRLIYRSAVPFLLVAVAFAQQQKEWRVGMLRGLAEAPCEAGQGGDWRIPWHVKVEAIGDGTTYEGRFMPVESDQDRFDRSIGRKVPDRKLILGAKLQFQIEPESGPGVLTYGSGDAMLRVRQAEANLVTVLLTVEKGGVFLPVPPYRVGVIRQLAWEPMPGFENGIEYPELGPRRRLAIRIESEGKMYEVTCDSNSVSALRAWDTQEPKKLVVGGKFAFGLDGNGMYQRFGVGTWVGLKVRKIEEISTVPPK